jgi:hypothetical protein
MLDGDIAVLFFLLYRVRVVSRRSGCCRAFSVLGSAHVGDHALDLRAELWSPVGVFRRFLGSDGTATEQERAH